MSPIHNGPMDAVRMFKDTVSYLATSVGSTLLINSAAALPDGRWHPLGYVTSSYVLLQYVVDPSLSLSRLIHRRLAFDIR